MTHPRNAIYQAQHRQAHPDRVAARRAVRLAVKSGRLVRQPCWECGATKVEGHHLFGYEPEFALEVQWLCRNHHLDAHRGPNLVDSFFTLMARLAAAR